MVIRKLKQWKLAGFWPYTPILNNSVETGIELKGITEWMDAEVPGCIHQDLLHAGWMEDPYYEMNSLKCEWVAERWWVYKTDFTINECYRGQKIILHFAGIDYKARIYLNNIKIGEHEGMYTECRLDISSQVCFDKENQIIVILENAPEEMGQIGHTSMTGTQKSRFNYKWDFSTRLIHLGLYDDVFIEAVENLELADIHVRNISIADNAKIQVGMSMNSLQERDVEVHFNISSQGKVVIKETKQYRITCGTTQVQKELVIRDPMLWYPNGYGAQPLYDLMIEIKEMDGRKIAEKELRIGLRTLEYQRNEAASEESLPYTIVANGTKVYVKGVNMVPLDLMYGSVKDEDYAHMLNMVKEANINLVRVWGGGLIEKEIFYNLCDEYGIMIWQEFIQSSSGIDNIPSKNTDFLALLKKTAVFAVKQKRNHVSLTVWSGGNELTDENGIPATYEDSNIRMLKEIVEEYDPDRLMLPTSASGPLEFIDLEKPGCNHDVHGPWKYAGVENHYHLFNISDSQLHSEFGCDGLSALSSLERFMGPQHLKVTNMDEDLVWRHHGEWWDTYQRDVEIFGEIESLENFTACSQFIQAEGLRYALEANRRRAFQNSGSIIWQFNEPWPNVSCTSLVDYYNTPKLAYYSVSDAYRRNHVSLKYDRLIYAKEELMTSSVFVHMDGGIGPCQVTAKIINAKGQCLYEKTKKVKGENQICQQVGNIEWKIPENADGFFVKLELETETQKIDNTYLFFTATEKNLNVRQELVQLLIKKYWNSK